MSTDFVMSNGIIQVDQVFIDNLKYMHTLKRPGLSCVNPFGSDDAHDFGRCLAYNEHFREALGRIFDHSAGRIRRGGRDPDLPSFLERALPQEPAAKLWVAETDIAHTVASFNYLVEICNREKFSYDEQLIVLSAMLVHDCAYPSTDEYRKVDVRLEHMVEGVKAFGIIASAINTEFRRMHTVYDIDVEEGYEERVPFPTISEETAIIGQHDNPSINRVFDYASITPKLMWAHREADRLSMLDKAGFALDLLRLLRKSKPYDPAALLKHVIGRHVEEGESYPNNTSCRVIEETLFGFEGKKILYRTNTGFEIFLRLARERASEYGIDLSSAQS